MKALLAKLPEWIKAPLRWLVIHIRAIPYYGKGRICPVCTKSSRRFRTYGFVAREEAECAHCSALERHRLLWLFVSKKTDLFDGKPKQVLHVAPEPCLAPRLQEKLGDSYITADLYRPTAKVRMDITNIEYPDESFDVIYCSHVLEHVLDDRKAMREFYRTLKCDGWAILLVPISADVTYEDASVVDPQERLKAFGQEDHVRRYGPDYADRLREAGFKVTVTEIQDLADDNEILQMGLMHASDEIFYCTKR
jgi:SAM-dependent methyltransferase